MRRAGYAEAGLFELLVGASSDDIRLTARVALSNPTPRAAPPADVVGPVGTPRPATAATLLLDDAQLAKLGLAVPAETPLLPVTAFSTFDEIRQSSLLGWFVVQILVLGAKSTAKGGLAKGLGDGEAVMQVCVGGLLGSSIGSLQLMTGGVLPDCAKEFFVYMLNGRYLSALARLFGCKF